MNRKGALGNQFLLIPFLFYVAAILMVVGIGVYIFLGNGYDTRAAEAELLGDQIEKCMINNPGFESWNLQEFYDKCGYDQKVIEENYIVRICKGSTDCIIDDKPILSVGVNIQQCGFKESSDDFPRCKSRYVLARGNQYTVLTASNQNLRRESA